MPKIISNAIIMNYDILKNLDQELLKNIKQLNIFGKFGDEVLLITKDDQIFAFGSNKNGCLGLGTDKSVYKAKPVKELCNKNVLKFAFGLRHVIVLTSSGQVCSFGYNEFGQLGNGTTVDCYSPKLIKSLVRFSIIDISCGAFHSMALTKSGRVYAWGFNFWGNVGNKTNTDQLVPIKVKGIESEVIIAINCGHHNSVALTRTGQVYSWGHNAFGQLGVGSTERYQNIPNRICFNTEDIMIKKIVCGQNHCILLSTDGHIYSFGSNYFGQIGNGCRRDQNSPIKLNENKYKDIGTCLYSCTSVSLGVKGRAYIWGKCADEDILLPRETPIKTLEDLFARYNYVSYCPIMLNRKLKFGEWVVSVVNGVKKRLI